MTKPENPKHVKRHENDMKKTLILYSTVDGQTKKICQYIADKLEVELVNKTDLFLLEDFIDNSDNSIDSQSEMTNKLQSYDRIIIGASIRYGKHRPSVQNFVIDNKETFKKISVAFFSVNLVARKEEKNTAETNSYVQKFLTTTDWQPDLVDVFAGALNYSLYSWFDTLMIRFIMWMTKGPTNTDAVVEYTDWNRVDEFVSNIKGI